MKIQRKKQIEKTEPIVVEPTRPDPKVEDVSEEREALLASIKERAENGGRGRTSGEAEKGEAKAEEEFEKQDCGEEE